MARLPEKIKARNDKSLPVLETILEYLFEFVKDCRKNVLPQRNVIPTLVLQDIEGENAFQERDEKFFGNFLAWHVFLTYG